MKFSATALCMANTIFYILLAIISIILDKDVVIPNTIIVASIYNAATIIACEMRKNART